MPKEQDVSLRQEWQAFKKKYPDFEKSKNFKSDVGPQLDKRDKAFDAVIKTRNELEEVAKELKQLNKNLDAALGGYGVIVKELAKDPKNKNIEKDFKRFEGFSEVDLSSILVVKV